MAKKRPTIADVRANKGKYQYTMMRVESWEELAAAEAAVIDMCSVPPELLLQSSFVMLPHPFLLCPENLSTKWALRTTFCAGPSKW